MDKYTNDMQNLYAMVKENFVTEGDFDRKDEMAAFLMFAGVYLAYYTEQAVEMGDITLSRKESDAVLSALMKEKWYEQYDGIGCIMYSIERLDSVLEALVSIKPCETAESFATHEEVNNFTIATAVVSIMNTKESMDKEGA